MKIVFIYEGPSKNKLCMQSGYFYSAPRIYIFIHLHMLIYLIVLIGDCEADDVSGCSKLHSLPWIQYNAVLEF